jgi:hypothetical protein
VLKRCQLHTLAVNHKDTAPVRIEKKTEWYYSLAEHDDEEKNTCFYQELNSGHPSSSELFSWLIYIC